MLQLANFYEQCFLDFSQSNSDLLNFDRDVSTIEKLSQKLFTEINVKRSSLSKTNPIFYLDHLAWTESRELIDDPDFHVEKKKRIINSLHIKNKVCGTYTTSIEILRPIIREINLKEGRAARILEIGSGTGKLTSALYEEFLHSSLNVELIGSDIVAGYVEMANREARSNKYNIDYKVIDAFKLAELSPQSYDIIFTLHSMHHFRPEELSLILAGAQSVATRGFVGIDGYRGVGNLTFIAGAGACKSLCSLNPMFFHDALISARRMYSAKQLEIIAKIGCPKAQVLTKNLKPGLTVLKVFF